MFTKTINSNQINQSINQYKLKPVQKYYNSVYLFIAALMGIKQYKCVYEHKNNVTMQRILIVLILGFTQNVVFFFVVFVHLWSKNMAFP